MCHYCRCARFLILVYWSERVYRWIRSGERVYRIEWLTGGRGYYKIEWLIQVDWVAYWRERV